MCSRTSEVSINTPVQLNTNETLIIIYLHLEITFIIFPHNVTRPVSELVLNDITVFIHVYSLPDIFFVC